MFTALVPKLGGLFAQQATQVIAAGLLTGIVGGSVGVATGAIPVVDQPAQHATALYECPGSGRIVTSVAPNQEVLVTRRSADGGWLEIYVGRPGVERAWAPAAALNLEAAPDSLPIGDCDPEITPGLSAAPATTTPTATVEPSPSPSPSPTPKPSKTPKPTAKPTPSPVPLTGPILTELILQDIPPDPSTGIYHLYPPGCTGYYTLAPFTVRANDTDGVEAVYLYFRPTGGIVSSVQMEWEGDDLYYGNFGSDGTWSDGPVTYWVEAEDSLGNLSPKLYGGVQQVIELTYCSD